jgi:Fic family protein
MERLKNLPYTFDFTNLDVYKHLSEANINLGELKGLFRVIDHLEIVIHLLNVKEAKSSTAIEDIYTSYEEIFQELVTSKSIKLHSTFVENYLIALYSAFKYVDKNNEITIDSLHKIQNTILPEDSGLRVLPGLKMYNKSTREVIHIPPQNKDTILDYYRNLLFYINHQYDNYDPLIKMALIHFQFESIHPYKDGNGRVGRILNVLYLGLCNRIDYPLLNVSDYIMETKEEYFYLMRKCVDNPLCLPEFIIYVLKGINQAAIDTIDFIIHISMLIEEGDLKLQLFCKDIYNDKIIPHIYYNLYTKNETFRKDLNISRSTATKYLKRLEKEGFLKSCKVGKEVLYCNTKIECLFQTKSHSS